MKNFKMIIGVIISITLLVPMVPIKSFTIDSNKTLVLKYDINNIDYKKKSYLK